MHVPYSMDDSEPDLYGGMGGYSDDEYDQTKWEGKGYSSPNIRMEYVPCAKFFTQEEMNKVIQHNIKAVRDLELENVELKGLLSFIYDNSEQLPMGCSQKIREALTK